MTDLLKEYKTKLTAIRYFENIDNPNSLVLCTIKDLKEATVEIESQIASQRSL